MKAKKLLVRRSASERVVFVIVFLIFAAVSLSYLYIFVWGFLAGLKTHDEVIMNPFGLPSTPHFEHYLEVFTVMKINGYNFFGMLLNSMYFSILGPLITNMMACMLAYATTKYKFPGSKLYGIIVTFIVILPIYGSGGSAYRLYHKLGLISSYSQIILAFGGMNMTYLYFQAAFSNLSWGYAEAAFIDGANDYTVFFKIMLPQVMNVFGTLFVLAWVGDWNNYASPLIYLPKLPTLASGIYTFELNMTYEVRMDLLYAAYMITAIPPLILFSVFNNALTSNLSMGGLKE